MDGLYIKSESLTRDQAKILMELVDKSIIKGIDADSVLSLKLSIARIIDGIDVITPNEGNLIDG
jgi:hypothetical protein